MSIARNNKFRAVLALAVLSSVILFYQNCSQVPEQMKFASQTDLAAEAPFPYDIDLDTYSYMSCENRPSLDRDTYFTIRMGALRPGSGVYLSEAFRDFASSKQLSEDAIAQMLDDNKFSRDARVQVSVRVQVSLRGLAIGPDGSTYPERVDPVWGSLSLPPLATNISQTDDTVKVNYDNVSGQFLLGQANLSVFTQSEIQNYLNTTGIAVAGFQGAFYSRPSDNEHRIIAPYDVYGVNLNGVFGKGYRPTFKNPLRNDNSAAMNHGVRALSGVVAKEVLDGSFASLESWSCPFEAQYRVVPNGQHTAAGCNYNATNTGLTGNALKAYNAAKTILIDSVPGGASRWKIDQAGKCVIDLAPTAQNTCYDQDITTIPIQWGQLSTDTCGGASGKQCPHYFSICFRP